MRCCFKNDGTQYIFYFLAVGWKSSFAQLLFYLCTVSAPVEARTMLYRVDSDVHMQTNEDW